MALHLNLYHEVQKARKLQRRDPLKLSIYGLAAMAAAFAIYYCIELGRMHVINQELAKVQAHFSALEPKAKAAKHREEELSGDLKKSELMSRHIEKRFYWAPLLEQLAQAVPREVQITRFGGEVSSDRIRKCSVTLDGISAGNDPRRIAEELRTDLAEKFAPKYKSATSSFKSLEDGTELLLLDGKQVPTAAFAINVVLTSGEEAAPAPQPRKKH